jgi:hypothetical protein
MPFKGLLFSVRYIFYQPTGTKGDFFMAKCYILQTPANWFFRRSVPADLRDKLGRREIKVTLQTGSKQAAIKLARALVVETDMLFSTMRGNSMSSKRIIDWLVTIGYEEMPDQPTPRLIHPNLPG